MSMDGYSNDEGEQEISRYSANRQTDGQNVITGLMVLSGCHWLT